jgi:hypothetical protein
MITMQVQLNKVGWLWTVEYSSIVHMAIKSEVVVTYPMGTWDSFLKIQQLEL